MVRKSFSLIFPFFWIVLLLGCASGQSVTAPDNLPPEVPDNAQSASSFNESHQLWTYRLIRIDPVALTFDEIPLRDAAMHLNIIGFLEVSPCSTCFKLIQLLSEGNGTILARIQIRNPYVSANLTGFDVRGITMFNGVHPFPAAGLIMSDSKLGDVSLSNPDGYSTLYNKSTVGHGLEGYIKGELAPDIIPTSLVNGYKYFISDNPLSTRNTFNVGDSITVNYEIKTQNQPFIFGYAVDASWAPPLNKPVDDPETDFGPEANCPEAWKIGITNIGGYLTPCSGSANITIDVYDHQGTDNVHPPRVECNQLFEGEVEFEWKIDGPGFARYEATIENVKGAPVGKYLCLISKEAKENNPSAQPWMNLTAYNVVSVEVHKTTSGDPIAILNIDPELAVPGQIITFDAGNSSDGDCNGEYIAKFEWDWENDGIFEEGTEVMAHSWDSEGYHSVQLRVTDDEGNTAELGSPASITIEKQVFNPIDLTPPWLNFSPTKICSSGTRLYVRGDRDLHIFDISNPECPVWLGWISNLPQACYMDVDGTYVYIMNIYSQEVLNIIDASQPFFAHVEKTVPMHGSDLCVKDGYAYVAGEFNSQYDLSVIDLMPVEDASVVASVPISDVIPYGIDVDNGTAYLAEGTGGIQVFDVDPPEEPSLIASFETPGNARDIKVADGYAFVADYNSRLIIYDIDPLSSAHVVSTIATPGKATELALNNGVVYVFCESLDGITVIDANPPESASIVNTISTPGREWGIAFDGQSAYIADDKAGIPILDVSSPESIQNVGLAGSAIATITSEISGGYAYLTAGEVGLEIVDIQPPETSSFVKSIDTPGYAFDVAESSGYAYLADGPSGLEIIDINPPEMANIIKNVNFPDSAIRVIVDADYAYVLCADMDSSTDALKTLDVVHINPIDGSNIVKTINIAGQLGNNATFCDLSILNGFLYIAANDTGLIVVDVDPPESASIVNTIDDQGNATDDFIEDGKLYVAYSNGWFAEGSVYDISVPDAPVLMGNVPSPGVSFEISAGFSFGTDSGGVKIVDIEPIENAFMVTKFGESATDVSISDSMAYISSNAGFHIYQMW